MKKEGKKLVGINGWLILPIIHLFYYAFITLIDLGLSISELKTDGIFYSIMLIDLALLGLYVCTLVFAFMKKRIAPILFISSYSANFFVVLLATIFTEETYTLFGAIIGATIWIWYFAISKRVKNTFIK